MSLCGLPLLGEALIKFFNLFCLGRFFIKISWVISGLLAIISLLISIVYCPVVLVMNDFCHFLDLSLAD